MQINSLFVWNLYKTRFFGQKDLYKTRFSPVQNSLFKSPFYGTLLGVYARARAREQALNKLCFFNKHPTHSLLKVNRLFNLGGWDGAEKRPLELVRSQFRVKRKSTAKPEKQSARGTRKVLVKFLRARVARDYKLRL